MAITDDLKEYMQLVGSGNPLSNRALALRGELERKLGPQDHSLVDADVQIERYCRLKPIQRQTLRIASQLEDHEVRRLVLSAQETTIDGYNRLHVAYEIAEAMERNPELAAMVKAEQERREAL